MKKFKKALALLLCAVLLVAGSVAGTLAYLLDQSGTVQNTFTVGEIDIELKENDLETGLITSTGNKYEDIMPGLSYEKEPVVTVKAGSEDCYVRAIVTVDVSKGVNPTTVARPEGVSFDAWFDAWANSFEGNYIRSDMVVGFNRVNWEVVGPVEVDHDNITFTYYLYYKTSDDNNVVTTDGERDNPLPALFNDIKIPSELDSETLAYLEGMEIKIVAHAIQADGFEGDAVKAWEAFDSQVNP